MLYEKGGVKIFDEYGEEYDWGGFVKRVVEFGGAFNWRTHRNNDYGEYHLLHCDEFTSIDGYRFDEREFF